MKNKFSEFINSNVENVNESSFNNTYNSTNVNSSKISQSTEELINKYSKYSTEELTSEFLKMAEEKRNNGTLDSDLLRYSTILEPYLTNEQKSKMNDLFNKVK